MLGFFFRHYDEIVRRYVVFDDGSTDNSLEILRSHPKVDLRPMPPYADPESRVLSGQCLQEVCWKESRGDADWVIVTNGQLWRLYSKAAHSRSTNFYEVDLPDVMVASGLSDPNEAFRYWWLFFRVEAFRPVEAAPETCWLDTVVQGSRDYAREVEAELKRRVFYDVVPALAHGFLHDRRTRLRLRAQPDEAELERVRAGTLTLLYRLLFLLYAESRDLLPVREAEYYDLSLKCLKE